MKHRQQAGKKAIQHETALEIARLAAKIMAEEGINDYLLAKQRAVQRLHLPENTALPSNTEVQQSLASHLELFDKQGLLKRQLEYRRLAVQLMEKLKSFQPLAVGAVADGIITETSQLEIHVFAATPEEITIALINEGIPYALSEQKFRFVPGKTESRPTFNFIMGDTHLSLCVFGEKERRKTPLTATENKPRIRIGLEALKTSL